MQSLQNDEIDSTLKTADELWAAYCRKRKDAVWAQKNVTEKISYFQDQGYGGFITKYAVPTRYMVMYDEYSHAAFLKYLMRLKNVGYRSKDDWIERQADYVKFLWRAYNPRGSAKEAGEARLQAYDNIKKEMDSFEVDHDKAKVKAEERRLAAIVANREALIEMLADSRIASLISSRAVAAPVSTPASEPIRAPVDTPVPVEAAEARVLTETQRRNAARRIREKIKRGADAVPQRTVEEVWLAERNAAREKLREERRRERARAKVTEREAEKDRMRKRWEETRDRPEEDTTEEFVFDETSDIGDLPSE